MYLYRVFPYVPRARAGQPGHPAYLNPRQGAGRIDNPDSYICWYLARDAAAAVGEVFGDLAQWTADALIVPFLEGARRALGVYELPDEVRVLDLDDARNLVELGLRPTNVVSRDRKVTQAWAMSIFSVRDTSGEPAWDGVSWWSMRESSWPVYGIWGVTPKPVDVQPLTLESAAVIQASDLLVRPRV